MSSDGYFDDDMVFDAAALDELDAIEAVCLGQSAPTQQAKLPQPAQPPPLQKEDSFCDMSLELNEEDLARLDTFIEDAYAGKAQPVAGPSKPFSRVSSSRQLTLFGDVLPLQPPTSTAKPRSQLERTKSVPHNPFGQQAPKTKQWDQTAFAKSGVRQNKSKGKGKAKAGWGDDDNEEGEEFLEFEQFPAPFVSIGPPPPMKLTPDLLEAKHWIYPINKPKRDYQYNIVKHSLFENTLVALPTGLGKTFIAGVVMLNYYRWFPEGKVVFVAPTKPLVAQQVNACHEICGIPGRDSVEMTGEVSKGVRARHWKEKRVFFMTPQTLVNDLLSENCDVRDIVLLVIDEAHRATGDYAYNQAVRYLMAKNPHFRLLALTATPGNKVESVQLLVDGLHISRIEIRDEQSLDLRRYIHEKVIKPHIIRPNEDVGKLRDMLVNLMDPLMKSLKACGLLRPHESAITLHPFRPQMVMKEIRSDQRRFYGSLSKLSTLARAMLYLLTGSIGVCHTYLIDASRNKDEDGDGDKQKDKKSKGLRDDPNFRLLMNEFEIQKCRGFGSHPKIEKLKELLIQHFGSKMGDEVGPDGEPVSDETKVMVFSSYRGVVDEIVEELSREKPLIRAARFIGQGTDKQGNKGLAQKQQLEVIKKFKEGEYNVLVATSIGEEGLDIGEIDITVCYDADKAPTRMVQRFGRTGRKRAGIVHALLAEAREEFNIDKAKDSYEEIQKAINIAKNLELYGDVERLLPDHMKPECLEKMVEIEEYVREEPRTRGSPKKGVTAGVKRKRNDDIARNMPDGASTGFVTVRDLVVKGTKKRKKVASTKEFNACGHDDETDDELTSGRVLAPARRTQSTTAASERKPVKKSTLKKSATLAGTKAPPKPRQKKKKVEIPTASQLSRQGVDDSDDMDIERGTILLATVEAPQRRPSKPPPRRSPTPPLPSPTPEKRANGSVLEISDSEPERRSETRKIQSPAPYEAPESYPSPQEASSPQPNNQRLPCIDEDMSWLVDDDDDDNFDFEIVDSSPIIPKAKLPMERMQVGDESMEISMPTASSRMARTTSGGFTRAPNNNLSNPFKKISMQKGLNHPKVTAHPGRDRELGSPSRRSPIQLASSPPDNRSSSPLYGSKEDVMPPPALPRRFLPASSLKHDLPEPSHPVRPVPIKRRRIIYDEADEESGSPPLDVPPSSQRRLHRVTSTPPQPKFKDKKSKRAKPSLLSHNPNHLFDGEAAHSGDDVSEGHSNSEDDVESESDSLFLRDSPLTQGPSSYNQTLAYRQSLLSQMPTTGRIPQFDRVPSRPKPFGRIDGPRYQHRRFQASSSPPPPDDDLDHYDLDSFVVDDDEEIL